MKKRLMDMGKIINETSLSKINLVANVRSGVLTAYNYHTLSPVDWEALERQFNETKEMIRQQIPGTRQENVPCTNPHTGKPSTTIKNVPCLIDPVKIQYDEWTDGKGAIHPTQRLPPAILHDCLIRKTRPTIPLSQYNEFLNEWGSQQYERVIIESFFLESDILEITNQQQPKKNGKIESGFEQILDSKHPWHSEPLSIAVRAWMELYSTRDGNKNDNAFKPTGGNTKLINQWLTDNLDKVIGDTTREHYRFIINPGKQGGPKKTLDE